MLISILKKLNQYYALISPIAALLPLQAKNAVKILSCTVLCATISLLNVQLSHALHDMKALEEEMNYLRNKDAVLSANIANVDTPGYKPKTLVKKKKQHLDLETTHPGHISLDLDSEFEIIDSEHTELKPNGNAVDLNHEMGQKSENALKFQETSGVYDKVRGLLNIPTSNH